MDIEKLRDEARDCFTAWYREQTATPTPYAMSAEISRIADDVAPVFAEDLFEAASGKDIYDRDLRHVYYESPMCAIRAAVVDDLEDVLAIHADNLLEQTHFGEDAKQYQPFTIETLRAQVCAQLRGWRKGYPDASEHDIQDKMKELAADATPDDFALLLQLAASPDIFYRLTDDKHGCYCMVSNLVQRAIIEDLEDALFDELKAIADGDDD